MKEFFYKNWLLYYILFFLLLGLLIYAVLWKPDFGRYNNVINELNNELEKCRNTHPIETIISNDSIKLDKSVNCDAAVQSGGQGITSTRHELGGSSGNVSIDYNMYNLPDQIKIIYDSTIVYTSKGLVTGSNTIEWKYEVIKGKPTYCIVEISAPYANTEWNYTLYCPH